MSRGLSGAIACRAGQTVRLVHRYGNIFARRALDDTLAVDVTVRVEAADRKRAAAFASEVELSLAAWADTVFASVLYPELVDPAPGFSYEVDLVLTIPDGVRFEASNAFGDVEVTGLTSGSAVSSRYGDVRFSACHDVHAEVSHGDVHVVGGSGLLGVNCSYGNVYLDETTDRVAVENRYGNVRAAKLDGDVTISNVMGHISADGGRGRWCLVSRYGEIAAYLDDSMLTKLDVIAELARVRLLLPDLLPFRIEGRTNAGEIGTPYRFKKHADGDQHRLTGSRGRGGPAIVFTGAWSDFYVGPDEGDTSR
ncbi:MAG TPA: hypothetical protein ENN51_07415 [candidate division WOR-3 bacterium]|uniref:Adhesin domain-containing protein n=1 Tax=candidate division WOR-3 bacterium TaxID=2052148 RepID=A0A7V0T6Y2_UNCW3|nr:hypothetical protein [candidate division WOR-3 bacterium]